MLQAFSAAYDRHRFAVLFFSILITLVGNSIPASPSVRSSILEFSLGINLALAMFGSVKRYWRTAAILVGSFAVARIAASLSGATHMLSASHSLWTLAAVLAAGSALGYVMREGSVDAERIYAALSVYCLSGLVFGVAFHLLDGLQPGSLRFGDGLPGHPIDIGTAIYFSFVTLATLGYRDVVPVTPPARSLATLEAVCAQLYLAVLIARLVSLHASRPDRGR